jgi:RNA polymerase sigma factor (TIGR02999 family)
VTLIGMCRHDLGWYGMPIDIPTPDVGASSPALLRTRPSMTSPRPTRDPLPLASPDEMYALVYDELKRIARHHLHASGAKATLSTTELVHEAFLKLGFGPDSGWEGRAHFFGAASRAMRQVLVDFARRRQATKRGGGAQRISLKDISGELDVQMDEMLALDSALDQLNTVSERLRQVVELRFFGGLGEEEVAKILGVTPRTVGRDWVKARLFLLRELDSNES